MKWASALVVLAACGGTGSPTGLYLHVTGSAQLHVTSLEVIAADPAVSVAQRTSDLFVDPMPAAQVPYYVERTSSGVVLDAIDLAAGYTLLIEPDPSLPLSPLVPIVIGRDGSGDAAITAIGVLSTTAAQDGVPAAAITVAPDEAERVEITMTAAQPVAMSSGEAPPPVAGQLTALPCVDTAATSGLVWYDAQVHEMRVVFPAAGQTDAQPRGLDLDCDGVAAPDDCDDLRADINPDATAPACDDVDYACAGVAPVLSVTACTDCAGEPGRELCQPGSVTPQMTCAACNATLESCVAASASAGGSTRDVCATVTGTVGAPDACLQDGCALQIVPHPLSGLTALLSVDDGVSFAGNVKVQPDTMVILQVSTQGQPVTAARLGVIDMIVTDELTGDTTYFGVGISGALTGSCSDASHGGGLDCGAFTEGLR